MAVASGATEVVLASSLPAGTAYTVRVATQPSGETCTVANGTGTITTANVSNVVVTCADRAYTLGGTISGLNGSGLVLANGTDTLPISSGASSFTLPTPVAYSSSYRVTVVTQPSGLSCVVVHGTGTMAASAVTNIAVSCTDKPFSVSGTISGLGDNSGLMLVNGSDKLAVSANAVTFVMPTPVAFGSSYAVSVESSPAGLTCSVAYGSGTMGAANVTNVAVTCADQSYSLGGTIAGLTQSGLVLANGADTLRVASGSSSFTMPTAVAYGSAYDLTVQTPPVGETCSLSNGSGTMPASAVSDVAVSCSVSSYTIGGSISGLTASGLVLLDNGADATGIAANATQFTMNTGVAYGGSYAITVETQPAGETCQVSDGSGSVSANVTSVTLSCAPWSSFTESVLYSFAGGRSGTGKFPGAGLVQGSDGNFYGTTFAEGASNLGTVFTITPAGVETLLYSFGGAPNDGSFPFGALIQGSDGNFYGTTSSGGANNDGTVFRITPAGLETVLYSFGGTPGDGAIPRAGLILGSDGNFYGTTQIGGVNAYGTVFRITPAGVETVLYSFGGPPGDGSAPFAALIQGSDGNFYGTTNGGGANFYGTVFMITPAGLETVLYSFGGAPDGGNPFAALVQGSDGNFYGATQFDGANNDGTVFRITPAGVETVLYSFGASPSDGTRPQPTLIQGSDGNFWGTTTNGGANADGTVFRITPAGVETVLYSFAGGPSDGANPDAPLIQDSDTFYGITSSGGANGDGVVFKIVPQ